MNPKSISFVWGALVLSGASAFASADLIPPPFSVPGTSDRAVFVDFQDAEYNITFDIGQKTTRIQSTIHFKALQPGLPVINLTAKRADFILDGQPVSSVAISPASDAEPLVVLKRPVSVGDHTLVVDHEMTRSYAPKYGFGSVSSAFLTNDDDGVYLQKYLPTNEEYDQYAMTFHVEVLGERVEHTVFTNGESTREDATHWTIRYPSYFNCSAGFFHILPLSRVQALTFTVDNGSGKKIPGVVYRTGSTGDSLEAFRDQTIANIAELSKKYGVFAHPSVTIYAQASGGGMEYHGATVSDLWALKHELAHSYFGRGVMPANGNANWIDEAMATYATNLPHIPDGSNVGSSRMGAHSPYYTQNDGEGYYHGSDLLSLLGDLFTKRDASLTTDRAMREWFFARQLTTVTNEDFTSDFEKLSGLNLKTVFARAIYGRSSLIGLAGPEFGTRTMAHPIHRKRSGAELRAIY